ncbi:unnamed protein product [Symbiodinium microadriaticum]|nr:unnamed protein product [Symbiodinium microadriaticum]
MEPQCPVPGRPKSPMIGWAAVVPVQPEENPTRLPEPDARSPDGSRVGKMQSWAGLSRRPSEIFGPDAPEACDSVGKLFSYDPNFSVSLMDLNLIIVGTGPVSTELLRQRRLAGGRACVLWTEQMPILSDTAAFNRHPLSELRSSVFHLRNFCWQPPSMSRTNVREVEALRAAYRCWPSVVSRQGPDIVPLHEDQIYSISQDLDGRACGIEVLDGISGTLLWSMSGAVAFAGDAFAGVFTAACDTIHVASELDVSVRLEDAKPLTMMSTWSCLWTCLYSFVHLTTYCSAMRVFEPLSTAEQLPWWRCSFTVGLFPYGFAAYCVYWGNCLAGTKFPLGMKIVGGLVASILFTVFAFTSRDGSGEYRPIFTVVIGGTMSYITVSAVIHGVWCRLWARCESSSEKESDSSEVSSEEVKPVTVHKLSHLLWACAHFLFTFGSWMFLYMISMVFSRLNDTSAVGAALFLTLATNLTEKTVSFMTTSLYTGLVYNVRCRSGEKHILGDQRRHLMKPVALTHAFCESTRLISLLSVTMQYGGWWWSFNLALNLATNVLERSYSSFSFLTYLCPGLSRLILPGISMVLHQEAKLLSGYAQYVSVVAYLTADCITGNWATSAFNFESICLIIASVVVELAEDLVISVGIKPNNFWRKALQEDYAAQPILHPRQILCIDQVGVAWNSPPLSLHGTDSLDFWEVAAFMLPATYFSLVLILGRMNLLLGAGYMHGVCPEPLPAEMRLWDGLTWTNPLRCA